MKTLEAKVGAFVVVCATILGATIYFVSVAQFNGANVPFKTARLQMLDQVGFK